MYYIGGVALFMNALILHNYFSYYYCNWFSWLLCFYFSWLKEKFPTNICVNMTNCSVYFPLRSNSAWRQVKNIFLSGFFPHVWLLLMSNFVYHLIVYKDALFPPEYITFSIRSNLYHFSSSSLKITKWTNQLEWIRSLPIIIMM